MPNTVNDRDTGLDHPAYSVGHVKYIFPYLRPGSFQLLEPIQSQYLEKVEKHITYKAIYNKTSHVRAIFTVIFELKDC